MNIFEKIIIGISLVAIASINGYAQEDNQGKQKHEEMIKRLNLTTEQGNLMKVVKEKYKPQLTTLRKSSASKEEKKIQRKELHKKMNMEIKTILSEAQYEEYLIAKKERKEGKAERKAKREENAKRLNLSPEQKEAMKTIRQKYKPQLIATRENSGAKKENKAKRKELNSQMEAEVKLTLNTEQFTEYLKIKEEKKAARKSKK